MKIPIDSTSSKRRKAFPADCSSFVRAFIDNGTTISSLLNLYNTCPTDSRLRYDVFIAIFDVAVKNDDLESLMSQFDYVDVWAKEWGLDLETERALYAHLADSLKAAGEE
jgi:hypothetical protein